MSSKGEKFGKKLLIMFQFGLAQLRDYKGGRKVGLPPGGQVLG